MSFHVYITISCVNYRYIPQGNGSSAIRGDQLTGNPRPPQYLSNHMKKTAVTLANDAKQALAEVRRIMTIQGI